MAEKIRFYTETHIANAVVKVLRARGADVLTAREAGMAHASDPDHLEFALKNGRVLVSRDGDFPGLHRRGIHHAGIIYFPQRRDIGHLASSLIFVFEAATAEELIDQILYF